MTGTKGCDSAVPSIWLAQNSSKRWGELFFLFYTPFWLTLTIGVIVPYKLYEKFTELEYLIVGLVSAVPAVMIPILFVGKYSRIGDSSKLCGHHIEGRNKLTTSYVKPLKFHMLCLKFFFDTTSLKSSRPFLVVIFRETSRKFVLKCITLKHNFETQEQVMHGHASFESEYWRDVNVRLTD
ncbi:hypothetical protein Leryth_015443 [Lithospermum erythrorhizon]|nr:hypothetical protein Leryth_015443 [Lithospermum erythrorhizon]